MTGTILMIVFLYFVISVLVVAISLLQKEIKEIWEYIAVLEYKIYKNENKKGKNNE